MDRPNFTASKFKLHELVKYVDSGENYIILQTPESFIMKSTNPEGVRDWQSGYLYAKAPPTSDTLLVFGRVQSEMEDGRFVKA